MIQRLLSRKGMISPSPHYSFRSGTESPSASSTQAGISADFPRLDKAAAKVVVKALVASGVYPSPKDLLVLPDYILEDWYNKEAVRYLQEQKAARQEQRVPQFPTTERRQ